MSVALSNNQFSSQASNYGGNNNKNSPSDDYSTDANGVASTLSDFAELHKLGDGSYS